MILTNDHLKFMTETLRDFSSYKSKRYVQESYSVFSLSFLYLPEDTEKYVVSQAAIY